MAAMLIIVSCNDKNKAIERASRKWFDSKYTGTRGYPITLRKLRQQKVLNQLKCFEVFLVYGEFETPPAVVIVAYEKHKGIYILPAQFNDMILHENKNVASIEDIFNILKLRVFLDYPRGKSLVINKSWDIPYSDNSMGINPERINRALFPVQIRRKDSNYIAEFFSWHEVGGHIIRWKLAITQNGLISIQKKIRLFSGIGDLVIMN